MPLHLQNRRPVIDDFEVLSRTDVRFDLGRLHHFVGLGTADWVVVERPQLTAIYGDMRRHTCHQTENGGVVLPLSPIKMEDYREKCQINRIQGAQFRSGWNILAYLPTKSLNNISKDIHIVEGLAVIGEFCKLFVASATNTAVWVFFIRLQLQSYGYLKTVHAIVFGILMPIAAIAAIIFF